MLKLKLSTEYFKAHFFSNKTQTLVAVTVKGQCNFIKGKLN